MNLPLLLPILVLGVLIGASLALETAAWSTADPWWGSVCWHASRVCFGAVGVMLVYLLVAVL